MQDFAWWSGLSLTVIRKAIAELSGSLEIMSGEHNINFYHWQKEVDSFSGATSGLGLQLLPAFDEYLISYKDRTKMLSDRHRGHIITVNGLFRPAMIEGGVVIGGWQVEKGKTGCKLKLLPFEPFSNARKKAILPLAEQAFEAYCSFREMRPKEVVFG